MTSYEVVDSCSWLKGSIITEPFAIARLIDMSLSKECSVILASIPAIVLPISISINWEIVQKKSSRTGKVRLSPVYRSLLKERMKRNDEETERLKQSKV